MKMTNYYNHPPLGDGGTAGAIIYNITTQVAWQFNEAWLQWMLDIRIPEMLGTGCFFKHQLVSVLDTDETDGPVYAVQYYAAAMDEYNRFMALHGADFKRSELEKWGNVVFSFSSIMQVVH